MNMKMLCNVALAVALTFAHQASAKAPAQTYTDMDVVSISTSSMCRSDYSQSLRQSKLSELNISVYELCSCVVWKTTYNVGGTPDLAQLATYVVRVDKTQDPSFLSVPEKTSYMNYIRKYNAANQSCLKQMVK